MSIMQIARDLMQKIAIEISAVNDENDMDVVDSPSAEEQQIMFYQAVITRANKFMDRNRELVFADVLNINSRGDMERAVTAYDKHYLLDQGLSLESTSDLAKALIAMCPRFKVPVPDDWRDVADYQIDVYVAPEKVFNRSKPII